LTTDGLLAYVAAVDEMLADRCDYGQLVKSYAQPQENERRYSPAECTGTMKVIISGNPDEAKICTSHVERQNLTNAHEHSPADSPDERLQQEPG